MDKQFKYMYFIIFLIYFIERVSPKTDGNWSEWGPWEECSSTCGLGYQTRYRRCDNPRPSRRGKKCEGKKRERTTCDTETLCPIDGYWSSWSAWECTVTCGGGTGKRERKCNNPPPMSGGKDCEGLDLRLGQCNTKICPDKVVTLPPDIQNMVDKRLQFMFYNKVIDVNKSVDLNCHNPIIIKIMEVYPNSIVQWTKDEQTLNLEEERTEFNKANIFIRESVIEDTGVYVCRIKYAQCCHRVMSVVVLAIIDENNFISIKKDDQLYLPCNYLSLLKVYGNLTQIWYLNDIKFASRRINTTETNSPPLIVDKVDFHHKGTWKCKILDENRNLTWFVNAVNVKVLPKKSFLRKFYEKPYFIYVIVAIVLICFSIFLQVFIYFIKTVEEREIKDFKEIRDILFIESLIANKHKEDIFKKEREEEKPLIRKFKKQTFLKRTKTDVEIQTDDLRL